MLIAVMAGAVIDIRQPITEAALRRCRYVVSDVGLGRGGAAATRHNWNFRFMAGERYREVQSEFSVSGMAKAAKACVRARVRVWVRACVRVCVLEK